MRVRIEETKKPEAPRANLPVNGVNESTIVAAAFLFPLVRKYLAMRLVPDHFQQKEHRDLWTILVGAEHRKLEVDLALVEQQGGPQLREYVQELVELKPEEPKNVEHHVAALLWDATRVGTATHALPAFFEALRDPKADPAKVVALGKAIGTSLEGHEDRKYLLDPDNLVVAAMREVEERVNGRAVYSYGVKSLDFYQEVRFDGKDGIPRRRMLPGTAPKQTTIITAVPGMGKTTLAQIFALGIAFPGWEEGDFETRGRSVFYCAWEPGGVVTFAGLAALSLFWSRSEFIQGIGEVAKYEGRRALEERMHVLKKRIRLMDNPFRRQSGERATNAKNLDLFQGYIADSGCEVVIADLWHRALAEMDTQDELQALYRQQAMFEELQVHGILLHQVKKDVETRAVAVPGRSDMKGSGGFLEVADTVMAVNRPALFKSGIPDNVLQIIILKQRYGLWPLVVEFTLDADKGRITNGKSVDYRHANEVNEVDQASGGLASAMRGKR